MFDRIFSCGGDCLFRKPYSRNGLCSFSVNEIFKMARRNENTTFWRGGSTCCPDIILEESHSLKCPFELLKKALIPMLPYPLFKRHDKGIN